MNVVSLKVFMTVIAITLSVYSVSNVGGTGLFMPNNIALWFVAGAFILFSTSKVIWKTQIRFSMFGVFFALVLTFILSFSMIEHDTVLEVAGLFFLGFLGVILFWLALEQWQLSHLQFLVILLTLTALGGVHSFVSIVQIHDPYHVAFTLTGYHPFDLAGSRPIGMVQQVNMTATLMATFALMGFYLTSYRFFSRISILWRVWVILSIFMALYVLFLSGSRAGMLAFVLGFFLLIFARYKWLKRPYLQLLVWFCLIGVAYFLARWLPGLTDSNELLQNKFDNLLFGTDIRWYLYLTSWELFLQSPWLGYGLGGYNDALVNYVASVGVDPRYEHLDLKTFSHPHNEFLYWILQAGIVAVITIVSLVIFYLKLLFKRRLGFALGILALSMPILLQTQLSYPFSLSALHLFLLLFLLQYGIQPYVKTIHFSLSGVTQKISYVTLLLLFISLSYLTWFTLKSIEDAYAFQYRLFLTAEQTPQEIAEMHYFEYASKHPVFKTDVEAVMNKTVEKALGINNYDTQRFIWWAEAQSVEERSELTQQNLIKARTALARE